MARSASVGIFPCAVVACAGLSILFVLTAPSQTKQEPPLVDVEIAVRGPDGHFLDKKTVVITVLDQTDPAKTDLTVITDSHGIARFRIPAGFFRLGVKVPGVGYGTSGATEFVPGVVARPELPPLAGLGEIDGYVPREVCTRESTVAISYPYIGQLKTAADPSGHFHFADVPGGEWFVAAAIGKNLDCLCALGPYVSVNVGQVLGNVRPLPLKSNPCWVAPAPSAAPQTSQAQVRSPNASNTIGHKINTDAPMVWARGKIKDEFGRPVENASVLALGTYYGGIRMMEIAAKTKTDADGYYELKGASGLSSFSATLIATAPGRPPAWSWPAFPQISWFDSDPPVPEPVTQDLVLPSKSGQLNVMVLREGKPAPGVSVAAYLENANLRDIWGWRVSGGVRDEIDDAAYPAATTDANGSVSFVDLLPGHYTIYALASDKIDHVRGLASFPSTLKDKERAIASGIPVRVGETTRHVMGLYQQSTKVSFRVLRPDGRPLEGNTPVQYGPVDQIQWNSAISLDANGQGQWDLERQGLWQLRFVRKATSSTNGIRAPEDFRGPYDLATAFVAISPSLPNDGTPILQGRHVEAPSARVIVQDSRGAPVHATVTLIQQPLETVFGAGSTDGNGEILFTGLIGGQEYAVHVSGSEVANIKHMEWNSSEGAAPPLERLGTQYAFVDQTFTGLPDSPNQVAFRPEPLCYIYGVVRSTLTTEIGVNRVEPQRHGLEANFQLRSSTGEFLAGPFVPGFAQVDFTTDERHANFPVSFEVNSATCAPFRFDIDLDKFAADAEVNQITGTPNSFLGMGGISTQTTGAQNLQGTIFLSDGVTPALGAQVMYFSAGQRFPTVFAMTDALGQLHPRGLWRGPAAAAINPAPLKAATVVALLPGERGATVYTGPIHRGDALRLILPPAISVEGSVTVGGENASHRAGTIRILAAYQGQGALSSALSVATTADARGHFALTGLTPGTYLVQATLDDIWLSSVATLHAENEKTQPITLGVPAPGTPVRLELRDRSGKPVVGRSITVERTGPLAYLWPHEWFSDGAGSIYIPTLEAGRHTIRVSGESRPREFRVRALPARPLELRITVKTN